MHSSPVLVAIDGPSASGKSTVSREVAAALGYTYVDSGALYRGLTWKAWQEGVAVSDPAAVIALLGRLDLQFIRDGKVVRFRIDGVDPGEAIRSGPVVERVSDVAAIPEVRAYVVGKLRGVAADDRVVMEGRDIGSVVFPDTPHKFYLDADPAERARRRHRELAAGDDGQGVDRVLDDLQRRDRKDATRKADPLQVAAGARVINTTGMSVAEVAGQILAHLREAGLGA